MFIGYTIACQQKFALRFCSEKHTNPFRVLLCDDYLTNHCFKYNKKTSIVIFIRKIPLQSIIKFILMCNALAQSSILTFRQQQIFGYNFLSGLCRASHRKILRIIVFIYPAKFVL